jgi:hypothetical protein
MINNQAAYDRYCPTQSPNRQEISARPSTATGFTSQTLSKVEGVVSAKS